MLSELDKVRFVGGFFNGATTRSRQPFSLLDGPFRHGWNAGLQLQSTEPGVAGLSVATVYTAAHNALTRYAVPRLLRLELAGLTYQIEVGPNDSPASIGERVATAYTTLRAHLR